ncbi:hypothetical protein BUALT_Bualt12G0146400 [Buddleja alternifolia]|uniref:Uncharacterized protein n=1 Tax=Buddleja alternifolia TaxID=168488 RepID=A0AAV6WYL4_9LAMI|nr:hypothetical protein BUALT_Bualt12G0146400 [Buddleja alternifolia]
MGCFLACFGFKNKKKRRKPSSRKHPSASGQQNLVSYIPLDSDHATINLDTTPKHITSDSKIQEKPKEPSLSKIKKKVSFNLNVKAYEPLPNEDDISSYLESENKWEFNKETIRTTYPPNYRYQNFNDSYDYEEDDDLIFEEDDFNFEENEDSSTDEDGNGYSNESDDDEIPSQQDFPLKLNVSAKNESDSERGDARDRSRYALSVLNPVENLSQWKAVKGKAARLKPQKENIIILEQEASSKKLNSESFDFKNKRNSSVCVSQSSSILVDASLSNWLGSLETQSNTSKG